MGFLLEMLAGSAVLAAAPITKHFALNHGRVGGQCRRPLSRSSGTAGGDGYDYSGDGHLGRHPGLPLPDRLNGSLAGPVEGPLWDQQRVNSSSGKHPPVDTLPGEFVSTGWHSPPYCLIQKQGVRTVVAYASLTI